MVLVTGYNNYSDFVLVLMFIFMSIVYVYIVWFRSVVPNLGSGHPQGGAAKITGGAQKHLQMLNKL